MTDLIAKYDRPVPRYTSYPTVPYWKDAPTSAEWIESLNRTFSRPDGPNSDKSWSLYIHIPFCESLCCFCACNTTISRNHDRYEGQYIDCVLAEWKTYLAQVPDLASKTLKNIHLGGGTPTFLSPQNLARLLKPILSAVNTDPKGFEGSIEVHPNYTTEEHLKVLNELGFNRISIGVQDFNLSVQKLVNRIQPPKVTAKTVDDARKLGFTSVNFDLIYGLPGQGMEEMQYTIDQTLKNMPDRIALYSLAIVPWIKPAQRHFKDEDLPAPEEKRALYEYAKTRLLNAGYIEIGMDHFSLANDDLLLAMNEGRLHRNFMGYTDQKTDILLGLGVSSISASPDCFHQNQKILSLYEAKAGDGEVPTMRGHKLTAMDQKIQGQILQLMTGFKTRFLDAEQEAAVTERLSEMLKDNLVSIENSTLTISETGKSFLRIVCAAFDERLAKAKPEQNTFSKAI
ncbi:MAG: oxygen-independent coproporphyrinogen III oxidase [Devosiaceae bacterium]|nr:oxygen-independent coproporphyrinogen III oxidase [Devosiaceae bacterium]